jgi:hypothetical protein
LTEEFCLITFPSVWHAFRAEKEFQATAIFCSLIPIPRELSSSCQGLAAKIKACDLEAALALLDRQKILTEKRGIIIKGLQ